MPVLTKGTELLERTGTRSIEYKGYVVNSDGTILNKDKSNKVLKLSPKGYQLTAFYYEGKLHTHSVHKFVWLAFGGVRPEGYELDHIDNDRANNAICNLQLLTKSQNNQKAYDSGNRKFLFGDTNPNSLKRKMNRGFERI